MLLAHVTTASLSTSTWPKVAPAATAVAAVATPFPAASPIWRTDVSMNDLPVYFAHDSTALLSFCTCPKVTPANIAVPTVAKAPPKVLISFAILHQMYEIH